MSASAAKNCSGNLLGPTASLYLPELICYACHNHKCKPCPKIKPYACKPQKQKDLNAPRTSAKAPQTMCKNLTLSDWLNVVDYHDTHQLISQNKLVAYFSKQPEGGLIFTQSSLSCHLSQKGHEEDQAKLTANPTALSAKIVWVVTSPDVEKALMLWVKPMAKRENL